MKQIHQNIREKHILGGTTRISVVRADDRDPRDWLTEAPVCVSLDDYRIAHCGIMHALPPFEIVRMNLSGTFFFACLDGAGQGLIDGQWRVVKPGQACIQPPFMPNALKARGRKLWTFCWVRYQEKSNTNPLVSLHAPSIGDFDGQPMRCGIEGLLAEASRAASRYAMQKWCDLIHSYMLAFSQPFGGDKRLLKTWRIVEHGLKESWTLDRLAETAGVSKEHLRRLCTATLGRAPIQHVAFLRMQHAAQLLMTTERSIVSIADEVGYANQFAFSNTFQRWIGCRPSSFRLRSR